MAIPEKLTGWSLLVLVCLSLELLLEAGAGNIRYSVPEETDKGSFVGSIAKDLGLETRELMERGIRIVSRGVDGVHAFLQTYSREISLTADSRKSHLIFPQPNYADTLISHESCEKQEFLSAPQSLLEDKEEIFSQ